MIQGNLSPKKLPDGDAVPEKSDVPDDEDENPLHGPLEPVDDGVAVDQPDRLTQLDWVVHDAAVGDGPEKMRKKGRGFESRQVLGFLICLLSFFFYSPSLLGCT